MKLTPKQKEVLINALAHEGDMRITNNGLKSSLMKKGLITHASGYGWGFGGIQTLTREGERIAILLKAAEQSLHPTPESGRELPADIVKSENALPAESG